MTAKMIFKLKSPVGQKIDNLCERFPLISSVIVQLAAAIFMVGVVTSVGLIGGTVIWLFYKAFGVMQAWRRDRFDLTWPVFMV